MVSFIYANLMHDDGGYVIRIKDDWFAYEVRVHIFSYYRYEMLLLEYTEYFYLIVYGIEYCYYHHRYCRQR
jgi:hypothetical protein